jgi:hypothetical protein
LNTEDSANLVMQVMTNPCVQCPPIQAARELPLPAHHAPPVIERVEDGLLSLFARDSMFLVEGQDPEDLIQRKQQVLEEALECVVWLPMQLLRFE